MKRNRWTITACICTCLATSGTVAAQGLQGDPAAIQMARRMVERTGGANTWACARSLYVVEESWVRGADRPSRDVVHRDLLHARVRADFPEGPMVMTAQWAWSLENGKLDVWSDARRRQFVENWPGNFFVLLQRIAVNDERLTFRTEGARKFAVFDGDRKAAHFELTDSGAPIRWTRFSLIEPDKIYEDWIYGPLRDFGTISLPGWGARADVTFRYTYRTVRLSDRPIPDSMFPPPPEDASSVPKLQ
jgi:hypothetical protein